MTAHIDDELVGPVEPTDNEVVTALRRLAAAQAQLLAAEQQAEGATGKVGEPPRRIPELEEARTALLWAQAELIASPRARRRRKAVDEAGKQLHAQLQRHGFASFDQYVRTRHRPDALDDPRLELARREYDDAQRAWSALTTEFTPRTIVLDLTGEEPRRLA